MEKKISAIDTSQRTIKIEESYIPNLVVKPEQSLFPVVKQETVLMHVWFVIRYNSEFAS